MVKKRKRKPLPPYYLVTRAQWEAAGLSHLFRRNPDPNACGDFALLDRVKDAAIIKQLEKKQR
jgi:hypothetical protein